MSSTNLKKTNTKKPMQRKCGTSADSPAGGGGEAFLESAQNLANLKVPADVMPSFTAAVTDLRDIFISMKKEMTDFTHSLNSTTEDIAIFRSELVDMKTQLKEVEQYKLLVNNLRTEVAELRQEISSKEQYRLRKDIEINGITEIKTENLHHLVNVLTAKLGVEIDPRDVDDVRRVGVRGSSSTNGAQDRPRPIVLTLTRRATRDIILKAARVRRGLSTDDLDVPGTRRVFINEHLTRANRILFSKTRQAGVELHFKYVWTSNGNIFMRRSETSSVLRVPCEATLDKLKAQNTAVFPKEGSPQHP